MITLPIPVALELRDELLQSASGTMSSEKAKAPMYFRLAHELKQCTGGEDYIELTPELVEIARQFGHLG